MSLDVPEAQQKANQLDVSKSRNPRSILVQSIPTPSLLFVPQAMTWHT
jgi:hypothetical protein